jgi:O-antigen ligase
MTGALVVRLLIRLSRRGAVLERDGFGAARALMGVLLVWLGFEIAREMGSYGLSSIREFANANFFVVCPLYVATFFKTRREILRALKGIAVFGLVAPIVLLPVVGLLRGSWGMGTAHRYFPAQVHLGLLFGIVGLVLLKKHGQIRVGWWTLYVAAIAASLLIIADSHRSVWLSCATTALVLVLAREIRLRRFWHWGFPVLGVVAVVALALSSLGLNLPHYLATRALAFVNPSADPTSDWRLSIWRQALPIIRAHVLMGQGYGNYYNWTASGGQTFSVQPHDTFIQLLLKTGVVGTTLAVTLGLAALRGLHGRWNVARARHDSWAIPVLVTGMAAVATMFAWGIAYGMVLYLFVFAGLGVAAALRVSSGLEEPSRGS